MHCAYIRVVWHGRLRGGVSPADRLSQGCAIVTDAGAGLRAAAVPAINPSNAAARHTKKLGYSSNSDAVEDAVDHQSDPVYPRVVAGAKAVVVDHRVAGPKRSLKPVTY